MPAAIAWVAEYAASILWAADMADAAIFLLANASYIGAAVMLIGGLAYSSASAREAARNAKDQYNAAQVDRLVNISSAVAPRELVLGRVRKGGAIFYKSSTGTFQRNLIMAIAVAGHEIDAVEQIYLNDIPVALDGNGYVTTPPYGNSNSTHTAVANTGGGLTATLAAGYVPGSASATYIGNVQQSNGIWLYGTTLTCNVTVSGTTATTDQPNAAIQYQYTTTDSYIRITAHLGGAGQTVDPDLLALFPNDWIASNTVQGVAYLLVNMFYNETVFPSGAPTVTSVIRGAKLYDPRTGTTVWSENPALMLRHVYQHPKFGKAAVTSTEDARFIAAANACDIATNYTTLAGVDSSGNVIAAVTETKPLYRAATVLPFGTPAKSAFDDLSQAMGGSWAFAGGELYTKAGVYTGSVMSLSDADLAVVQRTGASETQVPIKISVHKARAQKFNTVKVKIWDQAQDYKQVSLTPLVGTSLLTRDGVELAQEISYSAIGYAPQALNVAGVMMRDARDALAVELPFKLRAYPIELFDTVDLTLSRYGWVNKTFMVLGRVWGANGTIVLTLKETNVAITQMDAGFLAQGFGANTNLPAPWIVASVGPLSFSTGGNELVKQMDGTVSSRMRISWAQVPDAAVQQNGSVEIQYRLASSGGAWTSLITQGNETQVVASQVTDSAYYIVRARAKTSVAVGDWGAQYQVQVIGKTAPPADVSGLMIDGSKLSWTGVGDIDLAGYRIKYQYGTNLEWGTANALNGGLLTDSPYTMKATPPGQVTIMVRAVDTTGNESLNSAYVVTNLGNSLVANVVESMDYKAAGWPVVVRPQVNLLLYSEQINIIAPWVAENSLSLTNATAAPDGTMTADKLVESASNAQHDVYQSVTGTANVSATLSVFAKAAERSAIRLSYSAGSFTNGGAANFDLIAGVVSSISNFGAATGTTASITAVGGGWYRCSVTATPTVGGSLYPAFILSNTGLLTYPGDGVSGAYLWGAQLEIGSLSAYQRIDAAYAPNWATNATLVSGNIQATQSDPFFKADNSNFYGLDGSPFYSTNYDAMEWISSGWTPSLAAVGSNMTVAWTLTGDSVSIQYRPTGPNPFFKADLAPFFGDDASPFYDPAPAWLPWPGSIVAKNQEYQWRVTSAVGPTSGLLSSFTVSVDVPDKNVKLNAVAIGAGGTRLSGSIGLFNVIQNIQLTLQGGSTAVSLEISDYSNPLGPLAVAKNAAGTSVTATIDALLQGY